MAWRVTSALAANNGSLKNLSVEAAFFYEAQCVLLPVCLLIYQPKRNLLRK
jgi:hypothetical protein